MMDPRVKPAGDGERLQPGGDACGSTPGAAGEPDGVSRVVMAEDQRGRDPC
jgi:hypothetical protein